MFLLLASVCLAGCNSKDQSALSENKPRTAVTVTHVSYGKIDKELVLSATTAYQQKAVVASPIAAFVVDAFVSPGARVRAGQVLYRLESKEQHALGDGNGGVVLVRAARGGVVLDVQQLAGGYVTEGAVLCTVAESGSLVFEINVPYEQRRYAHSGSRCMIELPDGSRLSASVGSPLASMSMSSQSERLVARAKAPFLPEGMNVKAIFNTTGSRQGRGFLLPKSAVQSDETLSEHWVMRLSDDSTVNKVPVAVGNSNSTEVEVISGALSPQDRIVLTGGYGLEDGARVTVTK